MTTKRIHNGLNKKEQKVLAQFVHIGRPTPMTLSDLAEACWGYLPAAKANSWVRNSIRRPVYMGLLEPVETGSKTGTYRITAEGRQFVKLGLAEVKDSPKATKPQHKATKKAAKKATKKAAKPAEAKPQVTEAVQAIIEKAVAEVNATPAKVEAPAPAPAPVVAEVKVAEPTAAAPVQVAPAPAPTPLKVPSPADLAAQVQTQVAEANAPWENAKG